MEASIYLTRLLLCQLLLNIAICLSDRIVYLDRPGIEMMVEPTFNPKSITANIGEEIQFIARFGNQRLFHASDVIPPHHPFK